MEPPWLVTDGAPPFRSRKHLRTNEEPSQRHTALEIKTEETGGGGGFSGTKDAPAERDVILIFIKLMKEACFC